MFEYTTCLTTAPGFGLQRMGGRRDGDRNLQVGGFQLRTAGKSPPG